MCANKMPQNCNGNAIKVQDIYLVREYWEIRYRCCWFCQIIVSVITCRVCSSTSKPAAARKPTTHAIVSAEHTTSCRSRSNSESLLSVRRSLTRRVPVMPKGCSRSPSFVGLIVRGNESFSRSKQTVLRLRGMSNVWGVMAWRRMSSRRPVEVSNKPSSGM